MPDTYRRVPRAIAARELRRLRPLIVLAGLVLVAGVLYWARPVLVPLALATLLTLLLNPVVSILQRRGLRRMVAVLLVVVMALSLVGAAGWVLIAQINGLADELPNYRENILKKIADMRSVGRDTGFGRVQRLLDEVVGEIRKEEPPPRRGKEPMPVVIQTGREALVRQLPTLLEGLVTGGLVIALVIFMMIRRVDLRNRVIRLAGHGRLPVTTRAIDEAAERVSHYLLMQSLINGGFGLVVGLGLFFIGLPYAVLWGVLAGILRFVPYLGPWLAALMPLTLALAVFDNWREPLLVVGLFLIVEPLIFLVIEPLLYGTTAGVSDVALLVAVGFWTWLWGPVGLVLATPLTVCLVVLGKHVPELEFMAVLLGDDVGLEPHVGYYQRLLAGDEDEATEIVETFVAEHPPDQLYDELLIPALRQARRDIELGRLAAEDEGFIVRTTREIVETLNLPRPESSPESSPENPPEPSSLAASPTAWVLGCPARDEMDWLALVMLGRLLEGTCRLELAAPHLLAGELMRLVQTDDPPLVCVAALPPGGLAHTRYLVKRLRQAAPDLKILVGRWGRNGRPQEARALLLASGADAVGTTLLEAREQIRQLLRVPARVEAGAAEVAGVSRRPARTVWGAALAVLRPRVAPGRPRTIAEPNNRSPARRSP